MRARTTNAVSAVKNADATTDAPTEDDPRLSLETTQDIVRVCGFAPDGESVKIERRTVEQSAKTTIATRDVRVVDFAIVAAFDGVPVIDLLEADEREVAFAKEVLGDE